MLKRFLLWLWRLLPMPFWFQWILLWLTTQKFLVGVVGIVINDAGEILLLNHTYRSAYPWGLPSGWLKANEDASDALEREVHEETSFRIHALRPLEIGRSQERPRVDLIFLCSFEGGVFQATAEVSDAKFFKPDALPEILPIQKEIISRALVFLGNEGYDQN